MRNKTIFSALAALFLGLMLTALQSPVSAAAGQPTLAIIPARNVNNDPALDFIGDGLAEALYTAQGLLSCFTVVERSQVDRILEEQRFSFTDFVEKGRMITYGKLLGARWLLVGSYFTWENKIRLLFKIVNTETGFVDPDAFFRYEADRDSLLEAIHEVVKQISAWSKTRSKNGKTAGVGTSLPSIAVPLFKNCNKSGTLEPISLATSELLQYALGGQYSVVILERMQIDKVIEELQFCSADQVDPTARPEIGHLISADLLLLGSFMEFGGKIQFNVRFAETETGIVGILDPAQVLGKTEDLFAVQDRLVKQIKSSVDKLEK